MEGELSNIKRWNILYPVYINSKKTMAQGRRIGLTKACENPTCAEIGDCCSYLKLPFAIEENNLCFALLRWYLDIPEGLRSRRLHQHLHQLLDLPPNLGRVERRGDNFVLKYCFNLLILQCLDGCIISHNRNFPTELNFPTPVAQCEQFCT